MSDSDAVRGRLIDLANRIQVARRYGSDDRDLLAEFEELLPDTDIDDLCNSDYGIETIVDICLGEKDTRRTLTPSELLELVTRFISPSGRGFVTEAESVLAVVTFNNNCRHPAGSDLIFYPEEHFDGHANPTAQEIVEKALRGM